MVPPTIHEKATSTTGSSSHSSSSRHHQRSRDARSKSEKTQDLLCRVRFGNTLPDIPFDPKFLACPFVDLNRFVEYKQTSLEKNYKHEILTEPDLGVKIDLIDPGTYLIDYTNEVSIDPKDAELLEEEAINPQDSKRSQQHSRIVPWMRKTEYISSEFNRYGVSSERQETKVGYNIKKALTEDNLYRDKTSQIDAISQTFEDAKKPVLQHHTKPGVVAVQELKLLPDFELWKYPFAQVIFDADPAPSDLPPGVQVEKMAQALIRGMMDETGEQFVAYFLPTDETLELRHKERAGTLPEPLDEPIRYDYKMAREYNWTVKNKATKGYEQENYFLVFREEGVFYNELETRVRLSRRRAKEGQPRVANSRLIVTPREQTEAELYMQNERLSNLEPRIEEEPEEAMEEETGVEEPAANEPEETKEQAPEAEGAENNDDQNHSDESNYDPNDNEENESSD